MDTADFRKLIDRLSPDMARALEAAAGFAAVRRDFEVRIEHVLSRLLDGDTAADIAALLADTGVDVDRLRRDVTGSLARVASGNEGKPGFGDTLMRWLEQALLADSLHYASGEIGVAAALDALAEMAPRLVGGEVFAALDGLDRERLRRTTPATATRGDAASERKAVGPGAEALAQYTLDFTRRAAEGVIDPVFGRSVEIRRMVDVLGRRGKNNPILVGEPGVGKTALVEGLALRIHNGEVPAPLRGVRLLGLDLGLLQAGASVRGEFERRLRAIIDAVRDAGDRIVLFIDEAHTLIGAGGEAGSGDAANLLKPALARGELRTIAATTWSEYRRYFERDAALARRFQPIDVAEPDLETALRMVAGLKERFERYHRVAITDAAVVAAVRLSTRYIPARQLPDKALDVLDTAAARVRVARAAVPPALETARERATHLGARIAQLRDETRRGLSSGVVEISSLETELAAAEQERDALHGQWQRELELAEAVDQASHETGAASRATLRAAQAAGGHVYSEVDDGAVATVISDWTGVPLGRMLEDELDAVLDLEARLGERVRGQSAALACIASGLRTAKAGLRAADAPLGVFLLAGPSGVGKTETARALAEALFGSERTLITVNMSEYQESHSVAQLKGAPPGYVGYGEGGVLTEAVRKRPYSVILLDEVEKAHGDVLQLFYQIFDRGMARDGEGREIDFRNTLILMTANLGAETVLASVAVDEGTAEVASVEPSLAEQIESIRPELTDHFGTALLARMDVVPYRPLDHQALTDIVALKLEAIADRLKASHGVELRCGGDVLEAIAGQCGVTDSGARHVEAVLERGLLPQMAAELLRCLATDAPPDIVRLEMDDEGGLGCVFAERVDHTAVATA